jgi:YbbR domain-containing protein
VSRFLQIVVHNWPLKLAAIGLATVLYGGLILSQDSDTFNDPIPIQLVNTPEGMFVEEPPPVTSVRYFRPQGTDEPGQGSFRAEVDLGNLPARAGTYLVRVQVTSVNPQYQVQTVTPEFVSITLDPLVTKIVPVTIAYGAAPANLEIGAESAEPSTVTVTGQQSIVDQVVAARADVLIQPSGLNVDQDVSLVPVDELGNPRSPVDTSPTTARIRVQVLAEPDTRPLPINPVITGTPAAGFELESVSVTPTTATVAGEADALAAVAALDTEAISISGLSEPTTVETDLALPDDIARVDDEPITVTVTFRPVTESRSFTAGLTATGEGTGLTYAFSVDRVLLVIAGSPPELDALAAADGPVATVDVTGLLPGTYDVPVTATLPPGLTLVAASPPTVSVTIAAPVAPSTSPSSSPAP